MFQIKFAIFIRLSIMESKLSLREKSTAAESSEIKGLNAIPMCILSPFPTNEVCAFASHIPSLTYSKIKRRRMSKGKAKINLNRISSK